VKAALDLQRGVVTCPKDVRFEVFTAVTMKNGVFWDVTPRGSETSVLTRATRRNILEDAILYVPGMLTWVGLYSGLCGADAISKVT
jgi:hypothetical protein